MFGLYAGQVEEQAASAVPEYPCPIDGCAHVFRGGRQGWDTHVASPWMHPGWHPDTEDGTERKQLFRQDYPDWF